MRDGSCGCGADAHTRSSTAFAIVFAIAREGGDDLGDFSASRGDVRSGEVIARASIQLREANEGRVAEELFERERRKGASAVALCHVGSAAPVGRPPLAAV